MHGCLVCQVSICLVGDFLRIRPWENQLIKPPFGRLFLHVPGILSKSKKEKAGIRNQWMLDAKYGLNMEKVSNPNFRDRWLHAPGESWPLA